MRAALVLVPVLGPLAVLASIVLERGLEGGTHDGPAAPTPDSFIDGTTLHGQWPQLGSVPANRTEGSIGRGRRQPNNFLEARQLQCDPGYIFVTCPTADPQCCLSQFPVCCPPTGCCPAGTYCASPQICCPLGSVYCFEKCCGDGATCCGTSCCMSGFTCNSGVCQIQIVTTSATTRNTQGTLTNIFPTSDGLNGATPSQNGNADNERPNSTNNAAVIGGVVGGAVGGLALIGGCVAAWYYYSHGAAGAAGAAGHSGAAGDASTLGNAGASGAAQGYGWTTGAPGSPSVDQPLMTSTGMLITPAAASDAGFAAQQAYGAPGTPYLQPSTPWNGTDDTQPPLSQYPQSAYGAAAPPSNASGSAPWAGGQTYGQPGGFGAPGSLAPNNLGRSAYSGVATEVMQPGQGAHGGPGSK